MKFRIAQVFMGGPDPQIALPEGARIEVWSDCASVGDIEYPHVAVGIDGEGWIRAIIAAELAPSAHDDCFLGLFSNETHTNLGPSKAWRDRSEFTAAAIEVLREFLVDHEGGLPID